MFRLLAVFLLFMVLWSAPADSADENTQELLTALKTTPYYVSLPPFDFSARATSAGVTRQLTESTTTTEFLSEEFGIEHQTSRNDTLSETYNRDVKQKIAGSIGLSFKKPLEGGISASYEREEITAFAKSFEVASKEKHTDELKKKVDALKQSKLGLEVDAGEINGFLILENESTDYIEVTSGKVKFSFGEEELGLKSLNELGVELPLSVPPATASQPQFRLPIRLDKLNNYKVLSFIERGYRPKIVVSDLRYRTGQKEYSPFAIAAAFEKGAFQLEIIDHRGERNTYAVGMAIAPNQSITEALDRLPLNVKRNGTAIASALGRESDFDQFENPRLYKRADLSKGKWELVRLLRNEGEGVISLDAPIRAGDKFRLVFVTKDDVVHATTDLFSFNIAELGSAGFKPSTVFRANGSEVPGAGLFLQDDSSSYCLIEQEKELFRITPGTVIRMRVSSWKLIDQTVNISPKDEYPIASDPRATPWTKGRQFWQHIARFTTVSEVSIRPRREEIRRGFLEDYGVLIKVNQTDNPVNVATFVLSNGRVVVEGASGAILLEFTVRSADFGMNAGVLCFKPEIGVKQEVAGRSWSWNFPGGTATTPGFAQTIQAYANELNAWQSEMPRRQYPLYERRVSNLEVEVVRPVMIAN